MYLLMTLKLIWTMCFSFQTIQFINEDLKGELLYNKKSEEEINKLMETGPDDKRRIEQLVTATSATEKALKIVSDISINPLGTNDEAIF